MNNVVDKLRELDSKLKNLNDISWLNKLVSERSASLFNVLADNIIFVSNESIFEIDRIVDRFWTWPDSLVAEVNAEIDNLVSDWNSVTNPTQKNHIKTRIDELKRISGGITTIIAWTPPTMTYTPWTGSPNLLNRLAEYSTIKTYQDSFNLASNIWSYTHNIWTASNILIDTTNTWFNCTPTNWFAFFDKNWKKINSVWGKYKFNMIMDDWAEREVDVEWITINNTTTPPQIEFSADVKFIPENIDYSKPLKLNLWWVYENASNTGISVVHTKELEINFSNPSFLNTEALRRTAFDTYNSSWYGRRIENQFNTTFEKERYNIEREALERALKHGDWPKYELLNTPELKEQFYQKIRKSAHPSLPWLYFDALYTAYPINEYNRFRDRFTDDNRDWNKDNTNISSDRKYRDFIHNNLEQKTKESIAFWLDQLLIDSALANNYLKWELTTFLDEIEKQKLDSNLHEDIVSDISDVKGWRHHLNKKRRHSVLWWFRLGPKDETPMRFFNWSKINIQNQKVNISTNTGPEDLNNKEPVEYWLELEISWKNKIEATIALEWESPFTLKSWDPAALVRNVLRNQQIKYWKVRAHIAYNIIKWIINMATEIDMPLTYSVAPWINREIKLDWDNIVLEEQNDNWSKRVTTKLFDYKLFELTNTFDSSIVNDNRSLRRWIDSLMSHVTLALNERHEQFCKATEFRWNTTTNFPTSYRTSPLKKLLNARTNTNFDFETTVRWKNWKNIQVSFSKNKFTINYEWLKKPISSKSLKKILNHTQWWFRVFDGVERNLCAWIYWELINKLRTNSKIAKTNFAVRDDVTWRTYVLDDDWKFGYLSHRDAMNNAARIKKKNWMTYTTKWLRTGWLITWWFLTGWVWAVLNPLSRKWLATIPLFAWWVLSAANLWVYWTRNRRKRGWFDYWVIDQNPPGLVMCSESQTRELLKNPLLMWRMIKAMSDRLGNIHLK
jgi:hypothetical protein